MFLNKKKTITKKSFFIGRQMTYLLHIEDSQQPMSERGFDHVIKRRNFVSFYNPKEQLQYNHSLHISKDISKQITHLGLSKRNITSF